MSYSSQPFLDWRERMPSQAVLDACDKAGMRWEDQHIPYGVAYSGERQTVYLRGMDDWEAAHELAHWILASPERRRLDEYGGGPGQFTQAGVDLPLAIEGMSASEDEQLAQALTVAILEALGLPGMGRRYSTWHMGTLRMDWDELRRRGYLGEGYVPVFMESDGRVLKVPGPGNTGCPIETAFSWWRD